MRKRWLEEWKRLPQRRIQKWIERIPRHIQEILRLEGGNQYKEGREDHDGRRGYWASVTNLRSIGHLSTRVDIGTDEISASYVDNGDWEDFMEVDPSQAESQPSVNLLQP